MDSTREKTDYQALLFKGYATPYVLTIDFCFSFLNLETTFRFKNAYLRRNQGLNCLYMSQRRPLLLEFFKIPIYILDETNIS